MKNNNRNINSLFNILDEEKKEHKTYTTQILASPSDIGVIRNNGRNGACYAPKAILSQLKKLNLNTSLLSEKRILLTNIDSLERETIDFEKAQLESSNLIFKNLNSTKTNQTIHLGGGHDHIFPLLKAIDSINEIENIIILNIDAHCDTRVESIHHSGTPFRNFDQIAKKDFHLIQYGIHQYANSEKTLTPITKGSESKFFYEDVNKLNQQLQIFSLKKVIADCPFEITTKTAFVLSLDCDGISGCEFQAVSSPNTLGVSTQHIFKIIDEVKKLKLSNTFFGIYEYNPVYEDPSLYCSKTLGHFIYKFLFN